MRLVSTSRQKLLETPFLKYIFSSPTGKASYKRVEIPGFTFHISWPLKRDDSHSCHLPARAGEAPGEGGGIEGEHGPISSPCGLRRRGNWGMWTGEPFHYLSFLDKVGGRETCEWEEKVLTRTEKNYDGLELLLRRMGVKSKQSQGIGVEFLKSRLGWGLWNFIIVNHLDCEIIRINI